MKEEKKIILTSISGLPNAGKSTLLNKLIEYDIAPISSKIQTTRRSIKGILNKGETQIIFTDTPGIFFSKEKTILESYILKDAWANVRSQEISILVFDPKLGLNDDYLKIIDDLQKRDIDIICFINKYDIKANRIKTSELMAKLTNIIGIKEIIFGSAKTGQSIDFLIERLITRAKHEEWLYQNDEITDLSIKEIAAEKLREYFFENLSEELPYSIHIETEKIIENENDTVINLVIYVEKENHKIIVIGKGGSGIKKAAIETVKKLKKIIKNPKLNIFVKVSPKWKEKLINSGII